MLTFMVQPDINIRGKSGDEVGQEHNSALHHGNDSNGDHEPLKEVRKKKKNASRHISQGLLFLSLRG
jgi:hypothetical protein